jgi:hypothetical protein
MKWLDPPQSGMRNKWEVFSALGRIRLDMQAAPLGAACVATSGAEKLAVFAARLLLPYNCSTST